METPKKILIVGGTGMLGQQLVKELVVARHQVDILTRTPEKFSSLGSSDVTLVKGDLIDKPSLVSACRGMDVVVASAHSVLGRGKYASEKVDDQGHRDLIDAARQNGVRYFMYISGIGAQADSVIDFWRTKAGIENYLKASGMTYTIIRASAFMERHVREFIGKPIMEKGKVFLFGSGEARSNFVSVRDVASVMKYCMDHTEMQNKTIEIGGLDNLSRKEIVEMYAAFTGKKVKVAHVPRGVLKVMSTLIKPFHPGISRILFVGQYLDTKDESFDVRPLLNNMPLKITTMEDFIRAG